jgi:hypothetical protein
MIVCDEMDAKTLHLGQALDVRAMILTKDIDSRLEDIVSKEVNVAPDKAWRELVPGSKV